MLQFHSDLEWLCALILLESVSLVLINVFNLLSQLQQLLKQLHPLRLQLPRIHPLPIRLQPVEHIMLLNAMPRRIPMVRLHEIHHLIVFGQPSVVLRHSLRKK